MRQAFDNLIKKLKQSERCQVSVRDDETFKKLSVAISGNDLRAKYGSVENFFETLFNNGHKKIAIQEYEKNGTGIKKVGEPLRFNFSQKNHVIDAIPMTQANPLGLAGQMGLGFAEIVNLNTDSVLKNRLEAENDFLKRDNERLSKEVYELKEEKLASKYAIEGKNAQNSLITKALEVLGPALTGMVLKTPSGGLNAPQGQLSDIKKQMMQLLSDDNFSDGMVEVMFKVIHNINTSPGFYEELEKLIP